MLNNIPDKFFVTLFLVMNVVGAFGYWFGFDYYVKPSSSALVLIMVLSASFCSAWMLFCVVTPRSNVVNYQPTSGKSKDCSVILAVASFSVVLLYFSFYYDKFILPKLIEGNLTDESSRPDVVGNIPMYWSFTVILSSFCIPFAVSGFVRTFSSSSQIAKLFWGFLLLFLTTMLGDKSTLLCVLFFLMFMVGRVSPIRVLTFAAAFFLFYSLVKYSYYSSRGVDQFFNMSAISESIFRRVSFINVSAMGVYLDQLLLPGLSYPNSYGNVKQFIFYQIYGYLPGGAPIPYVVSGFGFVSVYFLPFIVFISSFLIFSVRKIFERAASPRIYYVVLYLNFYGAIVLVSGSLVDYLFRSVIPIVAVILSSRIIFRERAFKKASKFDESCRLEG